MNYFDQIRNQRSDENRVQFKVGVLKDIFQATTRAVGRKDKDATVLDRCANEGDDILMANLGHLFQFLANISG